LPISEDRTVQHTIADDVKAMMQLFFFTHPLFGKLSTIGKTKGNKQKNRAHSELLVVLAS